MFSERPFADGRQTAVFVFNALRADAGRLTQQWLARLRAFDEAGWATHAVLINKDAQLAATISALTTRGRMPADTQVHHYALRDRRIRAVWSGPLPEGGTIDPRVGDWLDWLTGQVPGAVVFADSPAAYPYLSHMTNPLVARVASVHLSHLAPGADPLTGPLAARFDERFAGHLEAFDAIVTETHAQADDVRRRFGGDLPLVTIEPFVSVTEPVRAEWSVAPAAPRHTILSVGALEPESGHGQILEVLASVLTEHPHARLRIVGQGSGEDLLRERADELGVASHVDLVTQGRELTRHLDDAAVLVWAAGHESWPLSLATAAAAGVPVVAVDARYGPREIVTSADMGELAAPGAEMAGAIGRALARWTSDGGEPVEDQVRAAARPLLDRVDPHRVGARWTTVARDLANGACDRRSPSLLVETVSTSSRIMRLPGILADSPSPLTAWACQLPGEPEPTGWLSEVPASIRDDQDGEPPEHPHAGPASEAVAHVRTDVLAFVAVESAQAFRIEFTDGSVVIPMLTTGFDDRIIAARVGNATLRRAPDGSVWVEPRTELLFAHNLDGRIVVRTAPSAPVTDVTHAVAWSVDLDWADLRPTPNGLAFTGILRARNLAPAGDSAPAICVTDVGGFSRVVGQLEYAGAAPEVDGLEWAADVRGVLATDPLVATTALARGALALHVGLPGLLVPVGGLWTHGRRERIELESDRGTVTLLPSPGGRVIVAPGKGLRARVSGAVRGVVTR